VSPGAWVVISLAITVVALTAMALQHRHFRQPHTHCPHGMEMVGDWYCAACHSAFYMGGAHF
jgi:hypothetical protein